MPTVALALLHLVVLIHVDDDHRLLQAARQAWEQGQQEEAVQLATQAIERNPKNPDGALLRGTMLASLRKHALAVKDFDRVLELDPRRAEAHHLRGCERFKLGLFKDSIDDFDRYLAMRPQERAGHWQRGITLYYAGRFEDGKKQFEHYEQVDTNDVENAVWHFLCNARAHGVDKARSQLLKIGRDRRAPMTEVYELFAGRAKPEEVLAAATAGAPPAELRNRQLFYAHLYLGLYGEVMNDPKLALQHLTKAADDHRISHYMGDVARVHRDLLKSPHQ